MVGRSAGHRRTSCHNRPTADSGTSAKVCNETARKKGHHPAHASSAIMIMIREDPSPAEKVNDYLSLLRQSGLDVVARSDNG
jgi:hypothetical protein